MKYLLLLLVLAGCATSPKYSVQDVNVGDTLSYKRSSKDLAGCQLDVQNIQTTYIGRDGKLGYYADTKYLKEGLVCGTFSCKLDGPQPDGYACFSFDAFRDDRPKREYEGPRGRADRY